MITCLTREDELIVDAKRRLATNLNIKDLGMMHYLLGIEVWHNTDGIFFGKGKYAMEIPKRFILQGNGHTYGIEIEATV